MATGRPGRPRVLVVDDSQSVRVMMARTLQRLLPGGTVLQAGNGALAVEAVGRAAARGEPFHAVLMDHNMPVMNGDEAVRRMRAAGCVALILGVTGNAMGQDTAQFQRAGCSAVLTKPVDMGIIAGMVEAHAAAIEPLASDTANPAATAATPFTATARAAPVAVVAATSGRGVGAPAAITVGAHADVTDAPGTVEAADDSAEEHRVGGGGGGGGHGASAL
jgi:CheY-like chemotaxis protein